MDYIRQSVGISCHICGNASILVQLFPHLCNIFLGNPLVLVCKVWIWENQVFVLIMDGERCKVTNTQQQVELTCMIVSLTLQDPSKQAPCPHVQSLGLGDIRFL